MRVATVVEGVCVTLDPGFDFIAVATDFLVERGYREESVRQLLEELRGDVRETALASVRIPPKLDRFLDRADRGDLAVRAAIQDPDDLLDVLARRVVYGLVLAASLVSTAYLYAADPTAAVAGGALALLASFLLYWSFREPRGLRAQPQFTRQALRERRERRDEDEGG